MKPIIGLDIGTSKISAAVYRNGRLKVIPDEGGENSFPMAAAFEKNGRFVLGNKAKKQLLMNAEYSIVNFLRFLALDEKKLNACAHERLINYKLRYNPDENRVEAAGAEKKWVALTYLMERLLEEVYKKIENDVGEYEGEAVLSIPAGIDFNKKILIKECAEKAGFKIVEYIESPYAAGLAYCHNKPEPQTIIVFDMGAGNTSVGSFSLEKGNAVEFIAAAGNDALGGDDIDDYVIKWMLDNIKEYKEEPGGLPADALLRMREAAEETKRELSSVNKAEINLPYLFPVKKHFLHFQKSLTKLDFELLIKKLTAEALKTIQRGLGEGQLIKKDIETVLMTGGQSRMPVLQASIENFFKKQPYTGGTAKEMSAMGAALLGFNIASGGQALKVKRRSTILLDRLPPGFMISDRYQVLFKIGGGGFGYVYKVREKKTGKVFALKILKPEYERDETTRERFLESGRRTLGFSHPNIVTTVDVISEGAIAGILMKYIEGISLEKFVEKGHFDEMPLYRRLDMLISVLRALIVLRNRNIFHGDLKPENVFVNHEHVPMLFDFELFRLKSENDGQRIQVTGTPRYMAPEHISGENVFGEWSEIYSLGLIMYRLFAGRFPKKADNPKKDYLIFDFGFSKAEDPQNVNPSIPDELAGIIKKSIRRKRDQRFQTFEELMEALEALQKDTAIQD